MRRTLRLAAMRDDRLGERGRRSLNTTAAPHGRDDAVDEQRQHDQPASTPGPARRPASRPTDAHDQDRHDAEQAIHQHRRHGRSGRDAKLRQAECPHDVAADAGGQKRSGKRADEKDPEERGKRRPMRAIDRAEQHDPSIRHQRAVSDDQQRRPRRSTAGRVRAEDAEHGSRIGARQDIRGQRDATRSRRICPSGRADKMGGILPVIIPERAFIVLPCFPAFARFHAHYPRTI